MIGANFIKENADVRYIFWVNVLKKLREGKL